MMIHGESVEENDYDIVNEYQSMVNETVKQTKMISCLSLIHNSLGEGNDDLKKALSLMKDDHAKYYDRYVLAMLNKCMEVITKEQINSILSPEKIYGKLSFEERNLIKVSPSMISMEHNLTSHEQDLLDHINEIFKESSSVLNENNRLITTGFFDRNSYTIVISAAVLLIVLIMLTIRSIFYDKKKIQRLKEE